MNTNHIILALLGIIGVLVLLLIIQRATSARKFEALAAELDDEQLLRIVEIEVNSALIDLKELEISKLKRQLAASEKLRRDLADKRWEEEALA